MKKIIFAFLSVFLVLGILSACSDTEPANSSKDSKETDIKEQDHKNNEEKESASEESKKTKEEPDKPQEENKTVQSNKIYKIGETAKIGNFEITITNATFTKPDEYTPAKKGSVLTLDLRVKNISDSSDVIDSTDFSLSDATGNMDKDYYGYDEEAISASDRINPGKTLTGKLFYDIPNVNVYELQYEAPFSLKEKKIIWKLPKSDIQYP
ncbi:hypothetical protein JOD45_002117 [Scopulibacillus daqui]|uniref:DUF4352 domain-containing protein n=1 Tax=Scopulibacillus daqui TaxID=1469162 RepID=A0ABS2Q2Y5_9BACL|nr:DUF4352 domain-containing protein [Scopulibacillus daqui]MBM7645892.1 hypothetical protein [Scopulibacillus daqui]